MPTVIRRGMFETNSSSSHSILILAGELNDTLHVDSDGSVCVYPGEWGWEPCDFRTAVAKASYALTWIWETAKRNQGKLTTMLKRVIAKRTGVKQSKVLFCERSQGEFGWPRGYIDHQSGPSEGGPGFQIWESDEKLEQFLFNTHSYLHTDNDNR